MARLPAIFKQFKHAATAFAESSVTYVTIGSG
jgi:hypothetical protein